MTINNNHKMGKLGQLKIQEMSFVLIAIVIFFAMVALVYFSIRMSSLKGDVENLKEESAKEIARKLADIPEFSWTGAGCSGCIDADKILALKVRESYKNFWKLDCLRIEKIYPEYPIGECSFMNYPNCTTLTLINKTKDCGVNAFVALCYYEQSDGGYVRCELGKVYASGG